MDPEEMRSIVERDVFRPYVIFMNNGRHYRVTHPETVHMTADTVWLSRSTSEAMDEVDDAILLAVANMSSVEPFVNAGF